MTQPEALRLADRLDLYAAGDKHQRDTEEAAAELRRLHAVNQELLAALKDVKTDTDGRFMSNIGQDRAYATARAAIAKAEGEAK
jgi:hypothetical protein